MNDIQEMQNTTGLSGVPSGFPSIDKVTMGWQKSDLIILAARPSVGKTAFALNLARNAAVDHHMPVAFFSLEMSALQLVKRLMTSESGLSPDKIKGGSKLEPYEWEQLEYKLKDLSKAPLYIDDTPGIPVMEFRTKLKTLVKQKGVRLVVVDYLQLMQGPSELRGMREQEVAAISRTLKGTAKELNVPIIAKHRNGDTCDIDMYFKSEQVKFVELTDSLTALATSMESAMNAPAGDGVTFHTNEFDL